MNEPLKRILNRFAPCDFFVAEQAFTLMKPVTMTAKTWHFGKPALRPQQARQLTAAPVDRLLTGLIIVAPGWRLG
jgi:hypothetical protein